MSQLCDCDGKPIDLAEGDALALTVDNERVMMYWLQEKDGQRKIYVNRTEVG